MPIRRILRGLLVAVATLLLVAGAAYLFNPRGARAALGGTYCDEMTVRRQLVGQAAPGPPELIARECWKRFLFFRYGYTAEGDVSKLHGQPKGRGLPPQPGARD